MSYSKGGVRENGGEEEKKEGKRLQKTGGAHADGFFFLFRFDFCGFYFGI